MEKILSLYITWDPSRAVLPWNIPLLNRPILWYGFFFALGFFLGYLVFQSLLNRYLKGDQKKLAEVISFYVVVGTIVGARLGDVLFYQSLHQVVQDPFSILKFWEGGLSSHGGVCGILISLFLFRLRFKAKYPTLTWVALLDLLCIPALLAGGFIRIGNFFNQEILGTVTDVPWAVVFGHPADGSPVLPRHPVQLYEALFYFAFFVFLWKLSKRNLASGKTAGLFFMGTFLFRFFVEFVKAPQSALLQTNAILDMGQWLSIPMILVGAYLFFRNQNRLRSGSVKGD